MSCKMKSLFSTSLVVSLLGILFLSPLASAISPEKAAKIVPKETGAIEVFSDYVEVAVQSNGNFTAATREGNPAISSDNNKLMLYGHPDPWSGATTIRIDGNDYWNYDEAGDPSDTLFPYKTNGPSTSGGVNSTVWNIGGVQLTQRLSIITSSSGRPDLILMEYLVQNQDSVSHNVGVRVFLDVQLANNDGAPFRLPVDGEVTTEIEKFGIDIPSTYQAFDDLANPSMQVNGILWGIPEVVLPDRVVWGYWASMNDTPWNYVIDPMRSLTDDSGVHVYWFEQTLAPGATRRVATAYGVGDIRTNSSGDLTLGVSGPATIGVESGEGCHYVPNPFTVTAFIQNTSTDNGDTKATVTGISAALTLSAGLSLAPGYTSPTLVGNLASGQTTQVSWEVLVDGSVTGDLLYTVVVSAAGMENLGVERTVNVPPLQCACDSGYYILDVYAGRHRVGEPPKIVGPLYYTTPIAKDMEVVNFPIAAKSTSDNLLLKDLTVQTKLWKSQSGADLAVLDGGGAVTYVAANSQVVPQDFYFPPSSQFPKGRAVDFVLANDGLGFWVLTDYGAIYRSGSAKGPGDPSLVPGTDKTGVLGYDIPYGAMRDANLPNPGGASLRAVALVVMDLNLDNKADGYIILDSQGGHYPFDPNGVPVPAGTYAGFPANDPMRLLDPTAYAWPFFKGLDIARDMELHPSNQGIVILDGWGGIHPVPFNDDANPVFFTTNQTSESDATPRYTVGMPYLKIGFDDAATPENEGDYSLYGYDATSIFADFEFSYCAESFYVMDAFGAVFAYGNARQIATDTVPKFTGGPYFFPYKFAVDMETFPEVTQVE